MSNNRYLRRLTSFLKIKSEFEKTLSRKLKLVIGYKPYNINLFQIALLHASADEKVDNDIKDSYERLEYLGDAILGAVVAEYLFKKYPFKSEGFLTNIRSRIVSRESLNLIARKIGIYDLILFDKQKKTRIHKSLFGNTLEALIAAVFIDRGFLYCRKFILRKLLQPNVDIGELVSTDTNYKSRIIEWSQKLGKDIRFETVKVNINEKNVKEFTVQVFINNKPYGKGYGLTKKKAEQDAAYKTFDALEN